jgi:phage-related protein
MSGKPTVTVTLAGDEKKLTESFDKVGTAAKDMGDKVDSASKGMDDSSSRFDSAGEAADGAEGKFMGFHDVLDGVKGGLETLADPSASLTDKLIGLGQAGADIAGGMASFLIPAIQTMWTKLMGTTVATYAVTTAQTAWAAVTKATTAATAALNAVMRANPILFVVGLIAALVVAFVVLWNKSAGFRNFFIGAWKTIQSVVGSVVGWIRDRFNGLMSFFGGLPSRIGRAMGSLGSIISGVFKGAVNILIDVLNWGIQRINDLIYAANVVSPFDDIPYIPKVGRLHTGGVVPGMPGTEQLMVLQAGEEVSTSGQGGGTTLRVTGDGGELMTLINYWIRTKQIQVA